MQITLNQTEIEKAILEYMHKRVSIIEGTEVQIEMKATRGSEGFSAIIDILDDQHEEVKQQEKQRVTKQKEEKLEEASRFLKGAVEEKHAEQEEVSTSHTEEPDTETTATEVVEPEKKETKNTKSIFNKVVKA